MASWWCTTPMARTRSNCRPDTWSSLLFNVSLRHHHSTSTSAVGQEQTSRPAVFDVRFGPEADIRRPIAYRALIPQHKSTRSIQR